MPGPVLCAVDLTPLADGTARFAAVFARLTGSPVTLLHVHERGDAAADAAARLAPLARAVEEAGVAVTTESARGEPAEAIVRRAGALGASAIVMGTHGGRGLERLMLGSVAERVLHHAPCVVATLRGPTHAGGPIRKIVCGADFADLAPLRAAARLAQAADAELVVVHAVPELPEPGRRSLIPPSYAPALLEEARRELAREIAALGVPAGRIRDCVVPGPAPRALLRCAAGEAADLLVVGVHPHVLGGATHPVVRGADCPVLTVPADAGGRELA
jgi:nucleotide-binding universal stress UspA family protein